MFRGIQRGIRTTQHSAGRIGPGHRNRHPDADGHQPVSQPTAKVERRYGLSEASDGRATGQDLSVEADIGGFSVGSIFSWQALAAYSFDFGKTGSVGWAGVIGYRALYVDYVQGSGNTLFETNLLQHGPLIGISARF